MYPNPVPLAESGIDESVLAYYNSLDVAERARFRDTLGGPEREQFERIGQGLAPGVDAEGADAAQGVELRLRRKHEESERQREKAE